MRHQGGVSGRLRRVMSIRSPAVWAMCSRFRFVPCKDHDYVQSCCWPGALRQLLMSGMLLARRNRCSSLLCRCCCLAGVVLQITGLATRGFSHAFAWTCSRQGSRHPALCLVDAVPLRSETLRARCARTLAEPLPSVFPSSSLELQT